MSDKCPIPSNFYTIGEEYTITNRHGDSVSQVIITDLDDDNCEVELYMASGDWHPHSINMDTDINCPLFYGNQEKQFLLFNPLYQEPPGMRPKIAVASTCWGSFEWNDWEMISVITTHDLKNLSDYDILFQSFYSFRWSQIDFSSVQYYPEDRYLYFRDAEKFPQQWRVIDLSNGNEIALERTNEWLIKGDEPLLWEGEGFTKDSLENFYVSNDYDSYAEISKYDSNFEKIFTSEIKTRRRGHDASYCFLTAHELGDFFFSVTYFNQSTGYDKTLDKYDKEGKLIWKNSSKPLFKFADNDYDEYGNIYSCNGSTQISYNESNLIKFDTNNGHIIAGVNGKKIYDQFLSDLGVSDYIASYSEYCRSVRCDRKNKRIWAGFDRNKFIGVFDYDLNLIKVISLIHGVYRSNSYWPYRDKHDSLMEEWVAKFGATGKIVPYDRDKESFDGLHGGYVDFHIDSMEIDSQGNCFVVTNVDIGAYGTDIDTGENIEIDGGLVVVLKIDGNTLEIIDTGSIYDPYYRELDYKVISSDLHRGWAGYVYSSSGPGKRNSPIVNVMTPL